MRHKTILKLKNTFGSYQNVFGYFRKIHPGTDEEIASLIAFSYKGKIDKVILLQRYYSEIYQQQLLLFSKLQHNKKLKP